MVMLYNVALAVTTRRANTAALGEVRCGVYRNSISLQLFYKSKMALNVKV